MGALREFDRAVCESSDRNMATAADLVGVEEALYIVDGRSSKSREGECEASKKSEIPKRERT